jgi:glutaredoxin-like protein NrdH
MQITIYTTSNCSQCLVTKRQFDKYGIRYDEIALEQHPELVEKFKELGLMSAPIVITDTKKWSGFRLDKIKSLSNYLFSELKNDG